MNFTAKEKEYLRGCLPTEAELMISWATPVLAASPVEQRVLIAAQIEVLDAAAGGFYADPAGWCSEALRLAAAEGGRHAD